MARTPAVSAKIRRACGLPERGPLPTNFRARAETPYELFQAARDAQNYDLLRIMGKRATNAKVRRRASNWVLSTAMKNLDLALRASGWQW